MVFTVRRMPATSSPWLWPEPPGSTLDALSPPRSLNSPSAPLRPGTCPPRGGPTPPLTSVALTVPASHAACPRPGLPCLGVSDLISRVDGRIHTIVSTLARLSVHCAQTKGVRHSENVSHRYNLRGCKHSGRPFRDRCHTLRPMKRCWGRVTGPSRMVLLAAPFSLKPGSKCRLRFPALPAPSGACSPRQ